MGLYKCATYDGSIYNLPGVGPSSLDALERALIDALIDEATVRNPAAGYTPEVTAQTKADLKQGLDDLGTLFGGDASH